MSKQLLTDQELGPEELAANPVAQADYEACIFRHCDLSNSDLSGINFTECQFENCNLSGAKIIQTTFNEVKFVQCKMLGLHFDTCNHFLFTISFDGCTLDYSLFYNCKMKKTVFKNCSLKEADFSETQLPEAVFPGSDLKDAKFEHTNLEKADLRGAMNYTIDPELNKINKAKFSSPAVLSLLAKYGISIE